MDKLHLEPCHNIKKIRYTDIFRHPTYLCVSPFATSRQPAVLLTEIQDLRGLTSD